MKVKLNRAGMAKLLREPGVLADLERRARAIANAAGEGHEVHAEQGRTRARAAVVTTSFEAMRKEATDRNLLRAFDAGRG
jgi:hypothetical protein